jgi:ribonuclease Z
MEPIKVTFLGTSGSVPQKDKNFASVIISLSGSNILFDAPEGTQRQIMKSDVSLMKVNNIFISHMHADHFLGLFGWIATMTLNQRSEKLIIFSPKGGKQKIEKILKEVVRPSFPIEYKELKTGIVLKEESFSVSAFPLKHEITCYGFVFKEKDKEAEFDRKKAEALGIPPGPLYAKLVAGKKVTINRKTFTKKDVMNFDKGRKGRKITIVSDTRPCKETQKNAKDSDLLIHEATFLEEHKQNALDALHSTAKEAAEMAKKAGAKKLALFHFSARINEEEQIFNEAKKEFKEIIVAKEFQIINL